MTYTRFGEFVRTLRITHHQVMGDMAKMLEVKIPFLSAVENGRKKVPADWIDEIANHYGLTIKEKDELQKAVDESRTQYKIAIKDSGINQRRAAMQFARSFDELDDDTAIKILKLLKDKEDRNN